MSLCSLSNSSMRYDFRIDPTEVKWGYHLETDEILTVGGMVKYVRGVVIDNVTVSVEVGTGGIEELKRLGDFVYAHMTQAKKSGETLRFFNYDFPWDLQVYIKNISGLRVDGVTKNYKLQLDMSVVKNNLELDVYQISDMVGGVVEGITNVAMIHTVASGETLDSIAERYYGDKELGKRLILDINTNRQKIDGNYISPGTQIIIPYITYDKGHSIFVEQPIGDPVNVLRDPNAALGGGTPSTAPVSNRPKHTGHIEE